MNTVIDPVSNYAGQFSRLRSETARREPGWALTIRDRAFAAFEAAGFPTTREEEWRFTSVAPIAETEFVRADAVSANLDRTLVETAFFSSTAATLVFVNGRYSPELSAPGQLPPGVSVQPLASAIAAGSGDFEGKFLHVAAFEHQPFVALNTALWSDGALLRIHANTVLEKPVHIVFASMPDAAGRQPIVSHPRVFVVADRASQCSIIESYVGAASVRYFTNAVTEVIVGDQAIVNRYKVQGESERSYHIATLQARLGRAATLNDYSVGFGGELVRNDIVGTLAAEGGECVLYGLYMADGSRLVDNHTTIDHAMPHCGSREVYKGMLSGRSRAVFNGKIIVRPDAQKTDAKQTNRALLLSPDAQINTKPQLEIFANDVKCTHGAAVGQMDEDALFYLRARGIPLAEARGLLIQAFAGDVLDRLPFEPVRSRMSVELIRRLGGRS